MHQLQDLSIYIDLIPASLPTRAHRSQPGGERRINKAPHFKVSFKVQTKIAALSALAVFLCLQPCNADSEGLYIPPGRPDSQEVVKLNADTTYKPGDKDIKTKISPTSNFETTFSCTQDKGLSLTSNADGHYVGCCHHDQSLLGSEDTEFRCCAQKHILAGNKDIGFSCCPEGNTFDGNLCQPPPPPPKPDPTPDPKPDPKPDPERKCDNGKKMVDGKCVCPAGTKVGTDNTCHPVGCGSNVDYGKCYMFKLHNGEFFGSDPSTTYYANPPSIIQGIGVFTFCKTESCTESGHVGSNDTFYIKDLRGRPKDGLFAGWFLNNYANGNHLMKTNTLSQYGKFSIRKYPECGKYCLGGSDDGGLYYACPAATPALTFWPNDKGVCVPIELFEIPCDMRDEKTNCAWGADCEPGKKVAGPPIPAHMEL